MARGGKRPGAGRKPNFKPPLGRPSKYDPAFCDAVVQCMGEGYSLGAFAGKVGIARSTINDWMATNPEFAEAVSRGKCARLVHWEDAAMRVAKTGGGPGTATIIVFGLKNMGADDWADKSTHEVTGKDGGAIESKTAFDFSSLSPDERSSVRTLLERRAGKSGGGTPGA